MYKYLQINQDGAIGRMRLNRPEVRNAFNRELINEIEAAALEFDRRRDVKVVILSAEGLSFCSGFDLKQFSSEANSADVRATVDAGRRMSQAVARMRAITVAVVQGHCVGGGVVLMAACDFRLAAKTARFSLPETDIGIPLAWGGVPALVRELGPLFATEFILSCRVMESQEAYRRGLINEVVQESDLINRAQELSERLARHSSLVLETTKAQITAARQSLCSDAYTYSDANSLHSALLDPESQQVRANYLNSRKTASNS